MIQITQAKNDADLLGILTLQQQNLVKNITPAEAATQGFVTVVHDLDILRSMNDAAPHTIAKDGDKVVGYALTMLPQFRTDIPFLTSLFDMLDELPWKGRYFKALPYFVMGQVCVAKEYRGMGVFEQLYQGLRSFNAERFEVVGTDISSRNTRSLRAHERIGFERLSEFAVDDSGEKWIIVGWGLR
jgi:GNAT superfamily N-acetyltransferase